MRVTMLQQISGYRDGARWPAPGDDIDLPDSEAEQLIAQRIAKPTEEALDDDAPTTAPDAGRSGSGPGLTGDGTGLTSATGVAAGLTPGGTPAHPDGGAGDGNTEGNPAPEVTDLDALRAEYRQVTSDADHPDGREPDRRWKVDRLRKEIDAAKAGG